MQEKILVIDDDVKILRLIKNVLESHHFNVTTRSVVDDINLCDFTGFDLVILDVMMPVSGLDICSAIRQQIDFPILFVTAKNLEEDLLEGIQAGADDYITKPFSIKELVARVTMHLRREQRKASPEQLEAFGEVALDKASQSLVYHSQTISLTKREFDLLYLLAKHPQQIFSQSEIYDYLYPQSSDTLERSVTEYIYQIRQKLKPYGLNPVKTVWGGGYKWADQ